MAPVDRLEPVSVNFGCSGVDIPKFFSHLAENPSSIADWGDSSGEKEQDEFSTYLVEPFDKAREAGDLPKDVRIESYWGNFTDAGEITTLNAVHMTGYNPTDAHDLTRAEMDGRRLVMGAVAALKKYTPGFEKARLRTFGSSLGVRESRKIDGRYTLSEHDVLNQARFEDSIGIFPEFLDGHSIAIMPSTGRYFQVPFGVIVPQKIRNLLVVGRSISSDHAAFAATRQMMCCIATGQGAGVASAMSLKDNVASSEVNISRVQKALEKQGVRIS
jgi:hypothetical protein